MSKRHRTPCHYCGSISRRVRLTRDHIVPRSKGGSDKSWNIVSACPSCNWLKGDTMPTCKCEKCRIAVKAHRDPFFRSLVEAEKHEAIQHLVKIGMV